MFQFCIEHGHPERDPAGRFTGWTVDSSDRYTVEYWPGKNLIGIEREKDTSENDPPRRWPGFEKKIIKVIPDYEYCYKLQKTQIRAQGGAEGLYNFIRDNCHKTDLFYCRIEKLIEYAMNEIREARTA